MIEILLKILVKINTTNKIANENKLVNLYKF